MVQSSKIQMSSNRNFGLVFALVFFIIGFWFFRGEINQIKTVPIFISFIFLILGFLNSKLLTPLNKLWFKFGILLGAFVSPIIMAIVYFIVVTPTGFIMKVFGKDILNSKFQKNKKTYWIERKKIKSSMKEQF